jgi:hypothetical protein
MAERVRKVHSPGETNIPGTVESPSPTYLSIANPTHERERAPRPTLPMQDSLGDANWEANDFLLSTKQLVGSLYRNAWERGDDACQHLASSVRNLTGRLQARAKHIKEDEPLRLLAVVAGTALVLGIVARVWRSSRHG